MVQPQGALQTHAARNATTAAESVEGLRPPREGFPYFAHADRFPFLPEISDYSAANAWWLADACFLVYGDATFIENALGAVALARTGLSPRLAGNTRRQPGDGPPERQRRHRRVPWDAAASSYRARRG